ncbi:MAG: pirin family protein [Chitinophagales bacterium]
MEKKIEVSYKGQKSKVGELIVNRLIPNRYIMAVGPIVFLDHLTPTEQKPKLPSPPTGEFAHPHRGIATFSYLFSGELEHYDSRRHKGTVGAGGAQWMKAGNGIVHDENQTQSFQKSGGLLHGLQFWINLPAKIKAENPDYLAVQSEDVPVVTLPDGAGMVRILIGEYAGKISPIKRFSEHFIYHITLNPDRSLTFNTMPGFEYAALIPAGELAVNGSLHGNGEVISFSNEGSEIIFSNDQSSPVDLILFGGEPYTEPIVAKGPFVMNTELEIAEAYRDYMNGNYGEINYAR